ncbi:hypothetical protein [Dyadobacter sp. Leaf189]|uniref:hypothetical protein n=1 Tax=Dyadobacter sp. Leaf189 TaxID=1736295 RepID=UPI0007018E0B|nr:hypothetical protein [Dyadobacter sp. Leaf189]KQS28317.1 hypothetical protein ASG33_18295 [Dyadobacter sp. Leaf189]
MSSLDILSTNQSSDSREVPSEKLRISKDGFEGTLRVFTGQQGEHIVSIIPSLNVSGYGSEEHTALTSLKENIETFFEDLFSLSQTEMHDELQSLGWQEISFTDEMMMPEARINGVLQNFDFPEKVKTSIVQAA